MKPREVYHFGPTHDERSVIVAVPSVEGGRFWQPPNFFGAIALISGIEPTIARQINEGDAEVFRSYQELDLEVPGRINMLRGAKVTVVGNTSSYTTLAEPAILAEAGYGVGWVQEFEPLRIETHFSTLD